MEQKQNCPLYGTTACAMLHMQSCEQCKNNVEDEEAVRRTAKLVDTYLEKIPEGGPAFLFESDTCTLCKDNPGPKDGYALFTFGHAEPQTVIRHLIIKRKATAGMMIPLQFAVCKKCRMRLLIYDYLPLLLTVLFGGISLIVISQVQVSDTLNAINELLPLGLWVALILAGYGVGMLLRHICYGVFKKKMYLNIMKHPFVRKMRKNGWFPIPQDKMPKAVFTKKPLDMGIGTAPGSAYPIVNRDQQVAEIPEEEN